MSGLWIPGWHNYLVTSDFAIKAKSDMMFLASLEIYGEVLFGMFDCKFVPFLTHECAHVQERVIAICSEWVS